jgi:dTDP-4-amino-4,6-dideoxygalactose transaminase
VSASPPWRIALADVVLGDEERRAVLAVLDSKWLSMGPVTEEFERAFAEALGGGHAVAVSNGTAALHLAAAAVGLGPGDEVICPALTFVATAAGMRHTGAEVRLADSTSIDDFAIDPAEIERLVGPRTKAVVVVHYGGYPADITTIEKVAEAHGLLVIEDAAHALGAEVEGRACGLLGAAACFSFFPNKNMTTAEGGMVVFRDEDAAAHARSLRSHGMTTLTWDRHRGHAASYDVVELGYNYRLDELRAALGIEQLARVSTFNRVRAELAQRYRERLQSSAFRFPTQGARGTSANHLAVVVAPSAEEREAARERLKERRIQTSVHYPAIHRFTAYSSLDLRLPVAEAIADRVLTLPLHPGMDEADVDLVCATLDE